MQIIHGSKSIHYAQKGVVNVINATILQDDVIMGRCIKIMNMVIGAQCEYVIMQLIVGNVIIMDEYAIKKDHNKIAKKMHKLIYHG